MSDTITSEESEFERLNGREMTDEDRRVAKEYAWLMFLAPPDHPAKLALFRKADSVPGFFERAKTALG